MQREAFGQLDRVDEVARLGACEDGQDLVGTKLEQVQRQTVARLNRVHGAIVNAEIDPALVFLAADSETD